MGLTIARLRCGCEGDKVRGEAAIWLILIGDAFW